MQVEQRRWRAALLAAVALGALLLAFGQHRSGENLSGRSVGVALGVASAVLLLQIRWPRYLAVPQVLVVCASALHPQGGDAAFFSALATILDLHQLGHPRLGWGATGAVALAGAGGSLVAGADVASALANAVLVLGCGAVGWLLGVRQHAIQQERELADLRMLAQRRQISLEVHDVVAYGLSQVVMRARLAATRDGLPPGAATDLEEIGEAARQSLTEVRSVIAMLADDGRAGSAAEASAAPESLENQLERVRHDLEGSGFDAQVVLDGPAGNLSVASQYLVGRVVRELAANTIRHADPAHPVSLEVMSLGQEIFVVSSNRKSTDARVPSSGRGLAGLERRIAVYGGSLSAGEKDGTWSTTVVLPRKASS